MEYRLKQYPLLLTALALLLVVVFLGAPLIGLVLILVGGYLLHRSDGDLQPNLDALSEWLIRNRYLLPLAAALAIVSGFVPISASLFPPSKLYGFPIAFVIYYLPPEGPTALIPPLSSLAVRLPEFFADIAFYFVLLWVIWAVWKRKVRTP